jgi:hypothetical protein
MKNIQVGETMNITYKPISELIPYVNNPRKNDKAVDAVASSIKNYGFRQPIVIDSKNEIIIGHTRLLAAKKLKMDSVPCAIVDDLTPQQIKGLRIADNKVAEYSEWDMDLLNLELEGLEEFTGFEKINFGETIFEELEKQILKNEYNENNLNKNIFEKWKEKRNNYEDDSIKQIVLTFKYKEYLKISNTCETLKKIYNLENYSDIFKKLVEIHEHEKI